MKRVRKVEAISPPIIVIAIGERISEPSAVAIAIGSIPHIVESAVIKIGLNRTTAPSITASNPSMPRAIN